MERLPVIARRLKEARTKAKLSQKSLGIAAGIDEFSASARINQYERGKHIPDLFTAISLAKTLNTPLPYLYSEDDQLAELILRFHSLDSAKKQTILDFVVATAVPR